MVELESRLCLGRTRQGVSLTDDNLETLLTKAEFDKYFKELLQEVENNLVKYHKQYLNLLEFRSEYREAYKTHRIKHYLDGNLLKFLPFCKRQIGYVQNKNEEE